MSEKKYIVKINDDYTIKLPPLLLEELDVKPGMYATIIREGDMLVVKFKAKRTSYRVGKDITVEEMEKSVEEMLDEMVNV
ncbi:MAG: hypothetical protein DRJ35_03995 [Thermoprotei archaeon]|nr:MAG: hypothetical protein DRJ35_03995 [Thermoprotei archaeon]